MKPLCRRWSKGYTLLVLLSLLLVYSCGGKQVIAPDWISQEEGITINFFADSLLNLYDNQPTALVLSIYQFDDDRTYDKSSKTPENLKKLLSTIPSDLAENEHITGVDFLTIHPGESLIQHYKRNKGTQFVAIIAGYKEIIPGLVNRLFPIPTRERRGLFKPKQVTVEKLTVRLELGPTQIKEASSNDGNN